MKIIGRIILLAAVVALGIWLWTFFFPSPETIIRRRLAKLASTASFTSKQNILSRAASINDLPGFFAPEIEIMINFPVETALNAPTPEPHTLAGRDEIVEAAKVAHATLGSLQIEFLDPVVTLGADKESATVNLTLRAKIPRDKNFIVQEMKIALKKIKDEWLIIRIETVKTLS